jgi:hypothetical protein
VRTNVRRAKNGSTLPGHRDITILRDDFGEKVSIGVQLAPAFRSALRRSFSPSRAPDRKNPSRSCGRREFQAQCRRAPA